MGCCASNPYATLKGTIKNDDKWESFTRKFQINDKEQKKFWNVWSKMDKKKKGEITFPMFVKAWKIPPNDREIVGRFFSTLDGDKANGDEDLLYFQEFTCMVFDFCTLRMDGFVEWTFKIFDPDGSGRMEKTEFLEMCRLCMGPKAAEQGTDEYHRAIQLFKDLDRSHDRHITLHEFRAAEREAAIMFAPMLELQEKLIKNMFGDKWWHKAQKYRYEVAAGRTPLEVYNQGGSFERGTKAEKKKKAKMGKGKVAPAADAREDD
mmetsp:Transcript_40260/g.90370  ORF Transcript_40260/g.90370 Transcript_40260/m.90370 type:complete len:263 (-) Transcript_40260:71-859(-)